MSFGREAIKGNSNCWDTKNKNGKDHDLIPLLDDDFVEDIKGVLRSVVRDLHRYSPEFIDEEHDHNDDAQPDNSIGSDKNFGCSIGKLLIELQIFSHFHHGLALNVFIG